ncbi:HEAT repeat domain-containing protein [Paenibacillus sp. FSL R10-2771]|uniref:HEAT repeat domain-containing protein n=1 Tax=Paenibacillus sp. FSL R10-2771 TaxID=2954693 RepID=UPI0030F5B12F
MKETIETGGMKVNSGKLAALPFQQQIENSEQWPLLAEDYMNRSGLPGPRANLSLAGEFSRYYARTGLSAQSLSLLTSWTDISAAEAEANDPEEFLPFCALLAYGAYYGYAEPGERSGIEVRLRRAMNDSRWRVREAAAMALQQIGEFGFGLLHRLLEGWRMEATVLELRAFIAALAHPPLLKEQACADYSLELSEQILNELLSGKYRQADPEHLRVLSKGMEYALSLFVASQPDAGFALLRRLAGSGDKLMIRIVKSNLGKKRLSQKYPEEVTELLAGLTII